MVWLGLICFDKLVCLLFRLVCVVVCWCWSVYVVGVVLCCVAWWCLCDVCCCFVCLICLRLCCDVVGWCVSVWFFRFVV